ncbi:MAG: hypothetical protein CMI16_16090 [Opitutaceae bacterium]|nr:hypothetical protein [Opitutaceae bacterium]|tara:strand:+ start:170 stop:979 length:810 start_codon:yes stop_codon:yes gene_type:complete
MEHMEHMEHTEHTREELRALATGGNGTSFFGSLFGGKSTPRTRQAMLDELRGLVEAENSPDWVVDKKWPDDTNDQFFNPPWVANVLRVLGYKNHARGGEFPRLARYLYVQMNHHVVPVHRRESPQLTDDELCTGLLLCRDFLEAVNQLQTHLRYSMVSRIEYKWRTVEAAWVKLGKHELTASHLHALYNADTASEYAEQSHEDVKDYYTPFIDAQVKESYDWTFVLIKNGEYFDPADWKFAAGNVSRSWDDIERDMQLQQQQNKPQGGR